MIPVELTNLPSTLTRGESTLETISTFLSSDKDEVREWITNLGAFMLATEGFTDGSELPLAHTRGGGFYIRELVIPKGYLIVGKIHKFTHPWFMLKGDISELTVRGVIRIKAPYYGITEAGTQRVGYAHEETIWATVHNADNPDDNTIIDDLTCVSYEEFDKYQESQKRSVV